MHWPLTRDVLLTGTAIFVIVSQVYSQHPSDVLLTVALALTVPAVADHAKALLGAGTGQEHSPSASEQPAGPSPRSSPPGAGGERPGGEGTPSR